MMNALEAMVAQTRTIKDDAEYRQCQINTEW